ncbi:UNVERIFIED_CONTAM: hypothetical protein GTU68_027914 [Idotea baltica]|nr:hypothetical protein [Idotea baltica]
MAQSLMGDSIFEIDPDLLLSVKVTMRSQHCQQCVPLQNA